MLNQVLVKLDVERIRIHA